jgi:hypothetical protein
MTEAKIQRLLLDAQTVADRGAPTYKPFERTAEGVRIVGSFPKTGEVEEKIAAEFVPLSDIAEAAEGNNPLILALYRIEDQVLPPGIPQSRTYTIG